MLIKKSSFPTYLEDITNIENCNIDVFVELENNYTYTVVVATAKNIEYLMDKENMNYFEPGHPFIIVKELTEEIIIEAIEAYAADDAYWLKLYHFAGDINKTIFNKLEEEHMEYLKELDELDNLSLNAFLPLNKDVRYKYIYSPLPSVGIMVNISVEVKLLSGKILKSSIIPTVSPNQNFSTFERPTVSKQVSQPLVYILSGIHNTL